MKCCIEWYLHPEASRVAALWRAWEHLRLDPGRVWAASVGATMQTTTCESSLTLMGRFSNWT
ncbi:DUF4913 domain-containing protein [Pseudarthrobacter equi]|uniref:DUF4913 domain-containing protein n=1 Tax=Pseudarthrobacter equi TaxID=728066 RepID=UPI003899ED39